MFQSQNEVAVELVFSVDFKDKYIYLLSIQITFRILSIMEALSVPKNTIEITEANSLCNVHCLMDIDITNPMVDIIERKFKGKVIFSFIRNFKVDSISCIKKKKVKKKKKRWK